MHPKALSISVIFLAVLGLHGAPIQDQEGSLVARDNKHISKPHPAAPPHNAGVHTPAHNSAAHIPAHNAAHIPAHNADTFAHHAHTPAHNVPTPAHDVRIPAHNVHSPPHNAHTPVPNAAHTPTHNVPKAGGACVLHHKRSRLWRRSPDCDPLEGKELILTNGEDKHHTFTLGSKIAEGTQGVVHHVVSHDLSEKHPLVVKSLKENAPAENIKNFQKEIKMIKQVKQLAFSGKDNEGITRAVMHHVPGEHLDKTEAWKAASGIEDPSARSIAQADLRKKAEALAKEKMVHHMNEHHVQHGDMHHGNIKFTEEHGELKEAHLVDWGKATHVKEILSEDQTRQLEKGAKGAFNGTLL